MGRGMKEEKYKSRLRTVYENEIKPALKEELNVGVMAVPKIEKIVVNMGVGEAISNKKVLEDAHKELMAITGQKPVINKARKSIATFKLREGMAIGTSVTLRKDMMYDFLDHLINIALPRVKVKYVYWWLFLSQDEMKKQASGGVQSFVSLNYLRNYFIPVPPIEEQKRIEMQIQKLFNLCQVL